MVTKNKTEAPPSPPKPAACECCGSAISDGKDGTWSLMCSCHGLSVLHLGCGSDVLERIAGDQIRHVSSKRRPGIEERVRQHHFSRLREVGVTLPCFRGLQKCSGVLLDLVQFKPSIARPIPNPVPNAVPNAVTIKAPRAALSKSRDARYEEPKAARFQKKAKPNYTYIPDLHDTPSEPQPQYICMPDPQPQFIRVPDPQPQFIRIPDPQPQFIRMPDPQPQFIRVPDPQPQYICMPDPQPQYIRMPDPQPQYVHFLEAEPVKKKTYWSYFSAAPESAWQYVAPPMPMVYTR